MEIVRSEIFDYSTQIFHHWCSLFKAAIEPGFDICVIPVGDRNVEIILEGSWECFKQYIIYNIRVTKWSCYLLETRSVTLA